MTKLSCRIVRVAAVEDFRRSKLSTKRAIQGYNPSSLEKPVNEKRFVISSATRLLELLGAQCTPCVQDELMHIDNNDVLSNDNISRLTYPSPA
jgi:hypothetical protein